MVIAPDQTIVEQDCSPSDITSVVSGYGPVTQECPEGLWADFSIEPVTIVFGNTITFTDLSLGSPVSWNWTFEGGSPHTSTDTIVTVQYDTIGVYDVTLVISDGIDTHEKIDHVYVVNPSAPNPDFVATETVIHVGESIDFLDLTTDNPDNWTWVFQGGSPINSTQQNPTNITYNYPGTYNVYLTCTNAWGDSYSTKYDYITVLPNDPVVEVCDTISNLQPLDSLMVIDVSPWGEIPGNNSLSINSYADKYWNGNNAYDEIKGFTAYVHTTNANVNSKVKFHIWDGGAVPGASLGSVEMYISDLYPNFMNFVYFENPVTVSGDFYIGYELFYFGQDVFSVSMAKDRGQNGTATLYLKYDGSWYAAADLGIMNYMHTSLAMQPIACNSEGIIFSVDEFLPDNEDVELFPNPSSGNVSLGFRENENAVISVFTSTGSRVAVPVDQLSNQLYELDFANQPAGIYFVNIVSKSKNLTKKIVINQ